MVYDSVFNVLLSCRQSSIDDLRTIRCFLWYAMLFVVRFSRHQVHFSGGFESEQKSEKKLLTKVKLCIIIYKLSLERTAFQKETKLPEKNK